MVRCDVEWESLVGQTIELRHQDHVIRQGRVEAVTDDSAIMWFEPEAPHGREMIMHSDGYDIRVITN